jgi:hypothetical protein
MTEVSDMKVYFYDRESGVYQGEGFESGTDLTEGVTISAPPPYERGFVPVFDRDEGRWVLRGNGFAARHPVLREPICRIVKPPE